MVMKIFGTRRRRKPLEQAVTAPGDWVSAHCIVERKGVAHGRMKRGRGLPETLVEIAATLTAGDMDEEAVEHHALLLVLVEAEVEKLSQITPALRCAEGVGLPNVAGARVAVLCASVT